MSEAQVGKVLAIALRRGEHGPMIEVDRALARKDAGVEPDRWPKPKRGVTFLAAAQWRDVQRELDSDLPWHARRANLLVDADTLAHLLDRTIRVGGATLEIKGETKPCKLMEETLAGLRAALAVECRGGVFGRVVEAGEIHVGDEIRLLSQPGDPAGG